MNTCNISVVIPTYNRPSQLIEVLEKILQCSPIPNEIIIHIDGKDNTTEEKLKSNHFGCTNLKIIKNSEQVGPGGGRNIGINHATNSIVASFDDDSYPIEIDYFQRLQILFDEFPKAGVVAAKIFHINEEITSDEPNVTWVSSFVGCGCAYRKEVFLETHGYVNLPIAYGMEEVDLSIRLHEMGWGILESPWLRVFHNTRLEHHADPNITAASISNQILLTYLRYPIILWGIGIGQCINRILWLIRHRRINGIIKGLYIIPQLIRKYHHQRQVVSATALKSYFKLRKNAVLVPWQP